MRSYIGISFIFSLLLMAACTAKPVTSPNITPLPALEAKGMRESWQIEWDKVVGSAKKEGEAMIFATVGAETVAEVTSAIKEKYGLKLSFITMGRGSEMTERILRERRAGLYTVDVISVGATTLISSMKPAGFLESMEPFIILPEARDAKAWRGGSPFIDKDRMIIPLIAAYQKYITRNIELVKEGEIKSFHDLLDSRWKGKMIINDPTQTGSGNAWVSLMVDRWGLEQTREYLKQFVKQEPVITRDGRLQIESVARGKYPLGIATRTEVTGNFMSLGAPIAPVRTVEGTRATGSGGVMALPSKRPHPYAATLLINWLLTREGQAVFVKGFGSPPARLDVPPPPSYNPIFLPAPGEPVLVEDEESILVKGTTFLDMAKEIFAPLFR